MSNPWRQWRIRAFSREQIPRFRDWTLPIPPHSRLTFNILLFPGDGIDWREYTVYYIAISDIIIGLVLIAVSYMYIATYRCSKQFLSRSYVRSKGQLQEKSSDAMQQVKLRQKYVLKGTTARFLFYNNTFIIKATEGSKSTTSFKLFNLEGGYSATFWGCFYSRCLKQQTSFAKIKEPTRFSY